MASLLVLTSTTGPAGGAVLATSGTLGLGVYTVTATVQLSGTTAAADLNNAQIQVGSTVVGKLLTVIPTATGTGPPVTVAIEVPEAGAAITVNAVGAGTGTAVYAVQLAVTSG